VRSGSQPLAEQDGLDGRRDGADEIGAVDGRAHALDGLDADSMPPRLARRELLPAGTGRAEHAHAAQLP
jgi:hypothetical protein